MRVRHEIEEISQAIMMEREMTESSWCAVLRSRANRRRLLIPISVSIFTLWTEQSVITYYFSPILDSIGITGTNKKTGINGGMTIWNLLCSILGAYLVDCIGCRPLWLASFAGIAIVNVPLIMASTIYAQNGSQAAAYVVVVFLFFYNAAFNLACNPLLYC